MRFLTTRQDTTKLVHVPNVGDLILHNDLRNKIFVKHIYIEDNAAGLPFVFGYNFNDITLNRDRTAIQNVNEFRDKAGQIIASILNGDLDIDYKTNDPTAVQQLAKQVLNMLFAHSLDTQHLHSFLKETGADRLWKEFKEKFDKITNVQITCAYNDKENYKLASKIPNYIDACYAYLCLKKSSFYTKPTYWLKQMYEAAPLLEINNEAIQYVLQKVSRVRNIQVKDVNHPVIMIANYTLFVPASVFKKEEEMFRNFDKELCKKFNENYATAITLYNLAMRETQNLTCVSFLTLE
jgi:hypothetical protein